jgi:hypothetical protein
LSLKRFFHLCPAKDKRSGILLAPPFEPGVPYVLDASISFAPWFTNYFQSVFKKTGTGIKLLSVLPSFVIDFISFQTQVLGMQMTGLRGDCRIGHSGKSAIGGSGLPTKHTNGGGSMKRLFGLALLVVFFAVSMGGCACTQKEAKSEPPPAQVEKTSPPPVQPAKPVPPPKKDRN